MRGTILHNAELLRGLNARIDAEFGIERMKSARRQASEMFWREHDRLAFPGGLKSGLQQLAVAEPTVIEIAVQFLEVDPHFYRSGYIKEVLLQRLKQCRLDAEHQSRLEVLIVRSLDGGGRREFRGYSRLAAKIHPPTLIAAVISRTSGDNAEIVRRARRVLQILKSNHIRVSD